MSDMNPTLGFLALILFLELFKFLDLFFLACLISDDIFSYFALCVALLNIKASRTTLTKIEIK